MTVPTSFTTAPPNAGLSRLNKVGLVLAAVLGLSDIVGSFSPTPEGEVGPPQAILVLGGLLGVVTVVGVVWAFRSASRTAVRIVAAARIISAITALPAFFVDVPAWLKLVVGLLMLVTVACVVMILTPARRGLAATEESR
ncbi:MAG: hypothetical protein ACR2HA_03335 [Nocardioides sp.]